MKPFLCNVYSENIGTEWKKWYRGFEVFLEANGLSEEGGLKRRGKLLLLAGEQVREIFFNLPGANRVPREAEDFLTEAEVFQIAVDKLTEHFCGKTNTTFERHLFRGFKQEKSEKIESFVIRLRQQAERCEFGDKLDENIRDQITEKCASVKLRRRILEKGDMDLQEIISLGKVLESVVEQEKAFTTPLVETNKENTDEVINKISTNKSFNQSQNTRPTQICGRCGRKGHISNDPKCPAKGKRCFQCDGLNHFGSQCRTRFGNRRTKQMNQQNKDGCEQPPFKRQRYTRNNETVGQISNETTSKDNSEYIFCFEGKDYSIEIECRLGGLNVIAAVDSGSKYNVVGENIWREWKNGKIEVANMRTLVEHDFKTYGAFQLNTIGCFDVKLVTERTESLETVYVMKTPGNFLLGRQTAFKLGLLRIGFDKEIIKQINNEPKKLNKIKGVSIKIPLKPGSQSVLQAYRRIPIALEEAAGKKIKLLLAMDVIERVNGPSKFISPMVVAPKGEDDVRICLDMRRINLIIEKEIHPIPTFENLLPHIRNAVLFSKIDIKNAFHQLELDPDSREITTFITKDGLFRYKRLMFGISCAPEMFQKIMEQILNGIPGCFVYIDDILVWGSCKSEHDSRLARVLERLEEYYVELNPGKCVYGVDKLEFLGHELSISGVRPKQDKLLAVKQFREPKSVEEVKSFLGLINYVGKFIPNVATTTEPLRVLTRSGNQFHWGPQQGKAFSLLKSQLASGSILGYYDPKHKTQLIADASPVGLGSVLVQDTGNEFRVIEWASRSLTETERRYCQTEKEALALVWAVERHHYYLYGRTFDLVTDHRALEVIFSPKSRPCARIERWVLRLQSYKYNVIYKPGRTNIADPFSRLCDELKSTTEVDKGTENQVNQIAVHAIPTAMGMSTIIEASQQDDEIQAMKIAKYEGIWSKTCDPFKPFETELCFAGDILLRGNRIVVPITLRGKILELAHEGHPGISVMKRRLRSKVWWPKIDSDAEGYVKNCFGCTLVSAPSAPEPIKVKELPEIPWQNVALDYLGPLPSGHHILVVVDYYTRFFEVEIMKSIDARETIKRLRVMFTRFGFPSTITMDNGKQLIGTELKQFALTYNIKLNHTIPYWPQQNGEVERQNRSLLKRLQIAQNTGSDWQSELYDFLLMYRTTNHSTTLKSPAELMFGGRQIRGKMPQIDQPLERDEELRDNDKLNKFKNKEYIDTKRNAKHSDIQVNDSVLVQRMVKNNKLESNFHPTIHKVISVSGGDTIVENQSTGKQYRRNIAHLKKVSDPKLVNQEKEDEMLEPVSKRTRSAEAK